jgi:hypothetical protein
MTRMPAASVTTDDAASATVHTVPVRQFESSDFEETGRIGLVLNSFWKSSIQKDLSCLLPHAVKSEKSSAGLSDGGRTNCRPIVLFCANLKATLKRRNRIPGLARVVSSGERG